MNRNTNKSLRAVWGFSSTDVFAAGWSGTILRYLPPVIESISPYHGNQGDILSVTITGKHLADTSEVRFGAGIAVNSFTAVNATQITANIAIVSSAELEQGYISLYPGGHFTAD
jgi:hypothetical protein